MAETRTRRGLAGYWPVPVAVAVLAGLLVAGSRLGGDDGEEAGGAGTSAGGEPPALAAFPGEDPLDAPDCDRTTGRLALPTVYSPNCVPLWPEGRDNGGATSPGVTGDTITVAIYIPRDDPTVNAIAEDIVGGELPSDEDADENRRRVVDVYEALYETYGRSVEVVTVEASGSNTDDAAAKADAIRVATEAGAFAAIGGPTGTNAYADELAARGVVCFCTASQPIGNYEDWSPYVWSQLMASTQGYVHRADYITGRLAGRKAEFAGDPDLREETRRFAIVYYETAEGAYQEGVDFFEDRLAESGVELAARVPYILDLPRAQEDAATIVARLKDADVTSVVFAGDPFFPIYLTQEATAQDYHPEWIVTGSTGTDTTAIARQYDQEQWAHAFGVSFLPARVGSANLLTQGGVVSWYLGENLTSYPNALELGLLFTGLHLAGPELTPETLRDGLFSFQPANGYATSLGISFGEAMWPWTDYLAADDVTEIWWDADATGADEIGLAGTGMYRYANEGKRYLPGEIGKSTATPFDETDAITVFEETPESDRLPEVPRRRSRAG
ncbi:MAG TPA: ABC transporter substrate-binding protein [Acidimicrobiales bacterium]|nr:ABC transporter substrate-binding protein [Acidimicrobiales bacterium]